jgi:hypothetical protein
VLVENKKHISFLLFNLSHNTVLLVGHYTNYYYF